MLLHRDKRQHANQTCRSTSMECEEEGELITCLGVGRQRSSRPCTARLRASGTTRRCALMCETEADQKVAALPESGQRSGGR